MLEHRTCRHPAGDRGTEANRLDATQCVVGMTASVSSRADYLMEYSLHLSCSLLRSDEFCGYATRIEASIDRHERRGWSDTNSGAPDLPALGVLWTRFYCMTDKRNVTRLSMLDVTKGN